MKPTTFHLRAFSRRNSRFTTLAILVSGIVNFAQAAPVYHWDFTTESNVDTINGVTANLGNGMGLGPAGYTVQDATDQGITVDQPSGLAVTGNWTIAMVFSLAKNDAGYQKLIDFQDYNNDEGVYAYDADLAFYNVDGTFTERTLFQPDEEISLIISRNAATKYVFATLNGRQIWGFTDTEDLGLFSETNNVIHFFQDDFNAGENPEGGIVKSIRVFSGALTPSAVLAAKNAACSRLKKAFTKAKKSKVPSKIKRARKKYNQCRGMLHRLRAASTLGGV